MTVGIGIKKTPPHLLKGERAKGERQEYIVRVIHPSDLFYTILWVDDQILPDRNQVRIFDAIVLGYLLP